MLFVYALRLSAEDLPRRGAAGAVSAPTGSFQQSEVQFL
jgi:hypothetical protein